MAGGLAISWKTFCELGVVYVVCFRGLLFWRGEFLGWGLVTAENLSAPLRDRARVWHGCGSHGVRICVV